VIVAISGKPGGGKSYYATLQLLEELVATDEKGNLLGRNIVTQLALNEKGILKWLQKRHPDKVDKINIYERIYRLEWEHTTDFWRYRGLDPDGKEIILPAIAPDQKPDFSLIPPGQVVYFLDEFHEFFNARAWKATGVRCSLTSPSTGILGTTFGG
jgi:hypothetical protein